MFVVVVAMMNAAIVAWISGAVFELSALHRERVFWIMATLLGTIHSAHFMRGVMAEYAIRWARQEEAASDNARSLHLMLEYLDLEFEGSVPDIDRYSEHAFYGTSPVVDAALKGLKLPDLSRPMRPQRDWTTSGNRTITSPVAIRKEPPVTRQATPPVSTEN